MGKSAPTPPPRDYYKETSDALRAQTQYAPALFAAEAAYRPMYQQLEMGGYRTALLGRVTESQLSDASRAEYRTALAKQSEAQRQLPILQAQLKRTVVNPLDPSSQSARTAIEAKIANLETIASMQVQPSAFSDRGLLDILTQDITPAMSRAEAQDASLRRESDIADVERLGKRASQAYLDADPRTKALLETLNAGVTRDLATEGRLSTDEQRRVEQQARAGFATRGLALGRQSVASELMNTQRAIDARKTMFRGQAATVLGLNKAFTADPFMSILGRSGQAFGAAGSQQAFGQGFASSIGPRLFSPESQMASDINASNVQTILATNAANATMTAGLYQGLGSAVGGAATGGLSEGGAWGCWVAREVYGEDNFKWIIFRDWMFFDSPEWFKNAYLTHGEKFAKYLKSNKYAKRFVKAFMDIVISKHTNNA